MAIKKHISLPKSVAFVSNTFDSNIEKVYPSDMNVKAKRPLASDLIDGEIAVNYGDGTETLTIRNNAETDEGSPSPKVVAFLNENVTYENEEIIANAINDLRNDLVQLINDESVKRANDDNEISYVTASVITSIVGKTYTYTNTTEDPSISGNKLTLVEFDRRITALETALQALTARVEALES